MLYPQLLSDINLSKWIDYTNSLSIFDSQLDAYQQMEDSQRKGILLTRNLVDRAHHTYAFFGGNEKPYIDDLLREYDNTFCKLFDNVEVMPASISHELTSTSTITFGQLIDAKMLTQGAQGRNKWELMQYICAIFFSGKEYQEEHVSEDNVVFKEAGELSMSNVFGISKFWEDINQYINENFTVFQDSGEKEGGNMKAHMQSWGWINFLKSIAKTKVFDISGSGLNSIDCARKAKAADVLTWASEEKDYNIALSRDMESK